MAGTYRVKREKLNYWTAEMVIEIPWWEHVGTPDEKMQLETFTCYPARVPGIIAMEVIGTRRLSAADQVYGLFQSCMDEVEFDRFYRMMREPDKGPRADELSDLIVAIINWDPRSDSGGDGDRPTPPQPS